MITTTIGRTKPIHMKVNSIEKSVCEYCGILKQKKTDGKQMAKVGYFFRFFKKYQKMFNNVEGRTKKDEKYIPLLYWSK